MKLIADPPFYPGEVVSGTVVRLYQHFALLNVRGFKMPLETHLISWDAVMNVSSMLEIGQRTDVMVMTRNKFFDLRRQERSSYSNISSGYWLSRLPLLENPWPALAERYPDGSVVEVELVEYDRKNDTIVKLPEGLMARVPMVALDRYARRNKRLPMRPLPGESFKVIVRGNLAGHYWLQPYFSLPPNVLPSV